jgi:RNA polymerase sigma-70 factor (family 1)
MSPYDPLSEKELLALLGEGDHAAFGALYKRYWRKLLHFALQKTGDSADAENLVQDVFVALWDRRESIRLTGSLENYLVVSVKYRVIRLLDKRRYQRLYAANILPADLLDDSTQEYLEFDAMRKRLEELLTALPENAQIIYRLAKDEGLSHRQIAEELDISEKAVNASLVRSRKFLRFGLGSFLNSILL